MEHSALHALELLGQVMALGGAFFVLGLLWPASRALARKTKEAGGDSGTEKLKEAMLAGATRWVFWGALGAALATALNMLVDVAETQISTIFGGVPLHLIPLFAFHTHVGRLAVIRIGILLLTAGAVRLKGNGKWWLVLAGSGGAVVVMSLVSHAAAQPETRAVMLVAQIAHIAGAALWVGVLMNLLAARRSFESEAGSEGIGLLAEMVRRFSPVALAVTMLLGLSGIWMVCRFLAEPGAVPTSAYGLTLMVKLLVLTPAIYAGWMNFRVVKPALMRAAADGSATAERPGLLRRFGRLLELETTSGVLVITVAGILASVSPPGGAGAFRLTQPQVVALERPHLPVVNVANPISFLNAPERTPEDLHYSEFTHNWSGVMVCVLGLGWLLQSARGRLGEWAKRGWPLMLIPFALFVAVAADPEVWWFHEVSPLEVLRNPQFLEHQLGAVMLVVLAWVGWKHPVRTDRRGGFNYALPIVITAGGMLLLGHAHSTLNTAEQLQNMINVQHAVFGTFIILAGMVNWLVVRELFPRRLGNVVWPSLIIGLGMYMAFCYRELV